MMHMEKPQKAPATAGNFARIALPLIATSCALYALGAGTTAQAQDPDFGCTVRQNIEVQTVNMDPQYEGTLMEGGVGLRSVAAVRRYMTDKVRPLVSASLASSVGQQGGAGAGAGGGVEVTGQGK